MKIKKLFALVTSICLLAVFPVSASAAKTPCKCGETPQVVVKGFLKPLYYNEGGAIEIPALLGHVLMDAQGRSILPATRSWHIDPAQDHSAEPEYEFLHDYRLDTFQAAAHLHDFIETLCAQTGHKKIALSGRSHGASIILTYLKVYGPARLDTFILANGTFHGATLMGEIILGRFGLSGPALLNVLDALEPESDILAAATGLLRNTPVTRFNMRLAGTSFLLGNTLLPMLRRMPSVWAMLPEPYFREARPLLDGYPTLGALVDKYHDEVQTQAAKLIKDAKKAGVKVAVFASYGKAPIPITQNTAYQCDFLADTTYESGGATVAPMGQTLPSVDSTPGKSKYRSPDGIIDAATCILPDQTWFIKYNDHFTLPYALQQWIIRSKTQPSITANPDFPQYLRIFSDGTTAPLK